MSRSGEVAEVVECLPSSWEILGSTLQLQRLAMVAHACPVWCGGTPVVQGLPSKRRRTGERRKGVGPSPSEEDNRLSLLLKAKFQRLLKETGIYFLALQGWESSPRPRTC